MNIKKHHIFDKELKYIKDESIKQWTKDNIDLLPDYIFKVGASSTGKYHPSYSLGEGGLIRHERGAMGIAIELFRCDTICGKFTDYDKDCILSALALHDCMKSGTQEDYEKSKYTKHEHPLLATKFLIGNHKNGVNQINQDTLKNICTLIMSHMGQWATNPKSALTLPKPLTPYEKFVHLCDFLGSRKCLEFNFDVGYSY